MESDHPAHLHHSRTYEGTKYDHSGCRSVLPNISNLVPARDHCAGTTTLRTKQRQDTPEASIRPTVEADTELAPVLGSVFWCVCPFALNWLVFVLFFLLWGGESRRGGDVDVSGLVGKGLVLNLKTCSKLHRFCPTGIVGAWSNFTSAAPIGGLLH